MHLSTSLLPLTLALQTIPAVSAAGFHLFTRYQNQCETECDSKTGVCWPQHYVEWRVGAVPSSQYGCNAFKDDRYFPYLISGENLGWNGYNFPDICGSGSVDFYTTNNGNNLEVWAHGANPGRKLATCYKQNPNEIDCGTQSCFVTKVHDVWVCADTKLC